MANHGNGCGAECTLMTPCEHPKNMICYEAIEAQKPDAVLSNSSGLLCCPDCGGAAVLEEYDDSHDDCTRRVTCKAEDCPGAHTWQDSEAEAVKLWNNRAI